MEHWYYITPDEYEQAATNGISSIVLEVRVRSLGWAKRRALTEPIHKKRKIPNKWRKIAESNGICYSTLRYRCNRLGWPIEIAATQSLQDRKKQAKIAHEASRKYPKAYLEQARQNGIDDCTFRRRVRSGWPIEKAATRPPMTMSECGLLTKKKREWRRELFRSWSGHSKKAMKQV